MTPCSEQESEQLRESYRVLQIGARAPAWAIKRQYRRLARKWHPDLFAERPAEQAVAAERMRQVNDAYQRIKDAPLRATGPRPSSSSRVNITVDLSILYVERDADIIVSGCLSGLAIFIFYIWLLSLGRAHWLAVAFYSLAFLVVVSLRMRHKMWDALAERLWPRSPS